jgi:hypothetical protein
VGAGAVDAGPQRSWRDGTLVILPPAVAQSVPNCGLPRDYERRNYAGELLAARKDDRWFCRVSIEIVPARGRAGLSRTSTDSRGGRDSQVLGPRTCASPWNSMEDSHVLGPPWRTRGQVSIVSSMSPLDLVYSSRPWRTHSIENTFCRAFPIRCDRSSEDDAMIGTH